MAPEVRKNFELLLKGELQYTSPNFGFNMLIGKLQKRVANNPKSMESCIDEADRFASKYQRMARDEFSKIANL